MTSAEKAERLFAERHGAAVAAYDADPWMGREVWAKLRAGDIAAIAKALDDARAEGMGEALEIAQRESRYSDDGIRWEDVERAIAERQAALRSGE